MIFHFKPSLMWGMLCVGNTNLTNKTELRDLTLDVAKYTDISLSLCLWIQHALHLCVMNPEETRSFYPINVQGSGRFKLSDFVGYIKGLWFGLGLSLCYD